jgi:hypothetical protein
VLRWMTSGPSPADVRDVDSLILAGALVDINADYVNIVKAHAVPANTLRSRFASLPDGYLSVEPRSLFTTRTSPIPE